MLFVALFAAYVSMGIVHASDNFASKEYTFDTGMVSVFGSGDSEKYDKGIDNINVFGRHLIQKAMIFAAISAFVIMTLSGLVMSSKSFIDENIFSKAKTMFQSSVLGFAICLGSYLFVTLLIWLFSL